MTKRAEIKATTIPRSRQVKKINWVSSTIAVVFSIVWFFPSYWMVKTAFTPRADALSSTPAFVPVHFTFENFSNAISQSGFFTNLRNSVIVVLAAVIVAIVVGMLAAAALSRFRFRGRRAILVGILILQMIPPTALLVPQFLVFNATGMLGNYLGLILAYVSLTLPFAIWVMRGFFLALPAELEEAAQLDGASSWQVLTRILFPLVLPGVIATSVFTFITAWNDYLIAYTFMRDQTMYTLPVWLTSFSSPVTGTDISGQMAGSVLFSLPVVVFFVLLQRKLVSGMSAGAVK